MINNQLQDCKIKMQEIIDLISVKQFEEANFKINILSETLNEIIDATDNDDDIIILSKYQVLLKQLFQKINIS